MKRLAIIPARGGSKRIPRKNIKSFLGKPIISYSILAAKESMLFDDIIVSTDDEEIANIARTYGAKVPFLRSEKNSDDYATTADVLIEVLDKLSKPYELVCCIYPTAPFVTSKVLKATLELLNVNNFKSVFPVLPYSFPIQRALKKSDNGNLEMFFEQYKNFRSQDLEKAYHDAGQFYWLNVDDFINTKEIYSDFSGIYVLNELHAQDIDTTVDWKLAELKYTMMIQNNSIEA